MAKCKEFQRGDRVRMVQGPWEGAEGHVIASCMMAPKSKYNPNPRAEQVWVRFDSYRIGEQHDIYDYHQSPQKQQARAAWVIRPLSSGTAFCTAVLIGNTRLMCLFPGECAMFRAISREFA